MADSYGQSNHVLDGVEIPTERGLSGQLKNIGSLCCGVRSKRDHSIVNNGTTAGWDCCNRLVGVTYTHIALSPVINPPPAMLPFVEILRPLLSYLLSCIKY